MAGGLLVELTRQGNDERKERKMRHLLNLLRVANPIWFVGTAAVVLMGLILFSVIGR